MFRPGQTYLVDMISRSIDYRLQFNTSSRSILCLDSQGRMHQRMRTLKETQTLTTKKTMKKWRKLLLSKSFHGSRWHLLALAQSAICLFTEFGRPTLFITFTCNPHWSEIKEMLLEGEIAYDRADVTIKVFHAKLERFLHNLRSGKYFGQLHKL